MLAVVFGSAARRRLVRDLDLAMFSSGRLNLMDLCKLMTELEDFTGVPADLSRLVVKFAR